MLVRDSKAALSFKSATPGTVTTSSVPVTAAMTYAFWIKPTGAGAGGVPRIFDNSASSNAAFGIGIAAATGQYTFGAWTSTGIKPVYGVYQHVVALFNGTTNQIYFNGVLIYSGTNTSVSPGSGTLRIGNFSGDALDGILDDFQQYNVVLTAAQILALYSTGVPPVPPLIWYKFNEGAGTSVADSSGNGYTGTVSTATFTADTPCKARQLVNQNLIKNGDFEYAPPFTAATTTNQRWIDGTASGSTTNDLFGWAATTVSGTVSAKFDSAEKNSGTYSLKLSTLAISSYIESHTARTDSAAGRLGYVIPVLPNTSYTYSFYMKTNYVSGDATNGAFMQFQTYDGGRAAVGGTSTTAVKVTQDWTRYTASFTTEATARFIVPKCAIYGHQGTGTLIMDAWYDSIELYPTTPTTRATA